MDMSPESHSWKDYAWAIALGCAFAVLSWCWGSVEIPPDLWEDVAVAAGLRPPVAPFPGLWHGFSSILFNAVGLRAGLWMLHALGPLSLGLVAAAVFMVLHELLPMTLRLRMKRVGWSRFIVRLVLMQATVCLVCAEPVWRACRFFSPTTLQLLLTLIAAILCCRAFRLKSVVRVYVAAGVLGVLAAETPVGLIVPMILASVGWWRGIGSLPDLTPNPLANPLVRLMALRRMTYAFFAGFIPAIVANAVFFLSMDGMAAHGWNGAQYVVHVIARYGQLLVFAASPVGWLFIFGFVGVPLVLASVLVGKATDEDKFLPYRYGLFFVLAGAVAFLQVAGWKSFWFWTWTSVTNVKSDYLLFLCALGSAVTLMFSLCVTGVEIYFRNYRRIAVTHFEDALEDPAAEPVAKSFRPVDRIRRVLLQCEPLVLVALVLPFRWQPTVNEMRSLVGEFVRRTAAECGNATRLFTDGAMDAGVEVAAAAQGKLLRTLSMMSGGEPREVYIRERGALDSEDKDLLATGASDALRTWVRYRPERMADVAIQLGFELWRHDKLPMPACGGFIARPDGGLSSESAAAGVTAAHALAKRMLALYEEAAPMEVPDRVLKSLFQFAQWRLARMCRMRADALDKAKKTDEAMAETELADRLDTKNEAYAQLRRQMDWVGLQKGARLTLREGLKLGLDRADFRMARTYAQQVLVSNPDDSAANFAIGMGYFVEEQYGRAEIYLKRSLASRPDEPAALNNLAIVLMRQGRYAEAETNALHALRVMPESSAVKKTVEAIREKAKSALPSPAGK